MKPLLASLLTAFGIVTLSATTHFQELAEYLKPEAKVRTLVVLITPYGPQFGEAPEDLPVEAMIKELQEYNKSVQELQKAAEEARERAEREANTIGDKVQE